MRIIKAKDYEDMSRKAANIIAAQVQLKPDCVLGLATGSTPIGTYKELVTAYENGDMEMLEKCKANLCMECGCCSYVCPAARPLVQQNKLAKAALAAWKKEKEENK